MHHVNKFELVSLELITCQYLDNVVLVDKSNNLFDHSKVAFDIVRHAERAQIMHSAQLVDQCIICSFHRTEVELQRWAVLPIRNLKKDFDDVANVVLLIQGFTLSIGERIQNLANSSQILDELFS